MQTNEERNNIWLFDNDLSEYQKSDEGRTIISMLTYNDNDYHIRKSKVSKKQLQKAFDIYWEARNTDVEIDATHRTNMLHYSDQEQRQKGKEIDQSYADAYREQN